MYPKHMDCISLKNTRIKNRGKILGQCFLGFFSEHKTFWYILKLWNLPNLKPKHVQVCRSQSMPAWSRDPRSEERGRKERDDIATHHTLLVPWPCNPSTEIPFEWTLANNNVLLKWEEFRIVEFLLTAVYILM